MLSLPSACETHKHIKLIKQSSLQEKIEKKSELVPRKWVKQLDTNLEKLPHQIIIQKGHILKQI